MLTFSIQHNESKLCESLQIVRTPSLGPVIQVYVDTKNKAEKLADVSNLDKRNLSDNWTPFYFLFFLNGTFR